MGAHDNSNKREEKAIRKARALYGDTFDYSKFFYTTLSIPSTITCKIHGDFEQTMTQHLYQRGSGLSACPECRRITAAKRVAASKKRSGDKLTAERREKKARLLKEFPDTETTAGAKTQAQAIADAIATHGDRYDYSQVKYTKGVHKCTIICKIHGPFQQSMSSHIRGAGCPHCSYLRGTANQFSTEEMIAKFVEVHGDRYDYSAFKHVSVMKKATIICKIHGPFKQQVQAHSLGHGCMKCRREAQGYSTEKVIELSKAIHGDLYDYSKLKYTRMKDKGTVICREHGAFKITMISHIRGKLGCPGCRPKYPIKDREAIIARATKMHNGFYDYSQFVYKGCYVKSTIICKIHGPFKQNMTTHTRYRNRGCPGCSPMRGYDNNKPGLLYYFSVNTPTGLVYKIGITNFSFAERYPKKERLKMNLIYCIKFADGEECSEVEQQIIKENQEFKYTGPPPLKSVGIKEMFTKRIYISMRDR